MTKSRLFSTVALFALIAAAGFIALPAIAKDDAKDAPPAAAAPPAAMPVSVATVLQKDITSWSEFSGRLRAVEDVQVRPRVSGAIEEMHFKEGDIVKKGDKLFTIDLRPYQAALDQAEASLAAAKARADLSVSDYKRAKTLFTQKAYSQREYDEKNNGWKADVASVKAAEAAVELAKLNLEYAEVTSPIDGRVGRPDITVGNVVEAGAGAPVLTTVQSIDPIYADFDIDEQTYLKTRKALANGQTQDMPVYMALADETDFTREGKIVSFDNQLSGASGTMRVRASFPNPKGELTPGLFARIRLGNAEKTAATLINDAAVGTDQDRKFVYTVDDKGNVNYRPVQLGTTDSGLRIVETGLKPGENIVVNGLMRVHPGMQVQPMMVAMDTLKAPGVTDPAAAPDGKPAADTPAADTKPATDTGKPAEDKAGEDKPVDDKPSDAKPAEDKPADATPAEAKPAEAKPAETKPAEGPADAAPADKKTDTP